MDTSGLSPLGRAAVEYAKRGFAIIPLVPGGKVPAIEGGLNNWSDNPDDAAKYWAARPNANIAVVCGSPSGNVIAIDLDCHGGPDGRETLKAWEAEHGELPETVSVITGSGGKHLLYRVKGSFAKFENAQMGVDVRAEGSYIVAPPSIHPNGEPYEWSVSPDDMDVTEANGLVYQFIEHVRPDKAEDGEREKFVLPDVIDKDRNKHLFSYASSLRATGRGEEEIKVLVHHANETRCKPPLGKAEVDKICKSSLRYEQGDGLRSRQIRKIAETLDDSELSSVFDRAESPASKMKDETVEKVQNVLLSLREVRHGLKLNVFDGRLHVLDPCVPNVTWRGPHVLESGESTKLRTVLERDYGIRKKSNYEDALLAFGATEGQQYDPMAEILSTLPMVRWADERTAGCSLAPIEVSEDGGETWSPSVAKVGTLTAEYLGVEPTSYANEVEKLMFRQLVARAKHPGCKADQMIVLVGKQGTGKSTFVSLLALDRSLFLEGFSDFNVEDLKRISGKLVVEIPELDGFTGKDKNRIKSIITQTTDNYRESYAKNPIEHPRTALFFGTTNDGTFLNDNTGARRYLLVESKSDMLGAHPGLFDGTAERDIRQAWAETIALYELWGEERFLRSLTLPRDVADESFAVQEKYTEEDATRDSVLSWISELGPSVSRVNVKMAIIEGMGFSAYQYASVPKWISRTVTAALDECDGWHRMEGKAKIGRFGTSRAWERDECLPNS